MRTYTVSIPGGTASTSIQIQSSGTLKRFIMSIISAAAGTWELSLNSASQIASATPAADVIARVRVLGAAGTQNVVVDTSVPVKAFQTVYLHCTGAGNVGELMLQV